MLVEKLKEFLKDAGYYGLSNVLGQLIGFFLIPLYTTYLTPNDFGVLTLLGFYTLFYSPLSYLGLHGAMFRYVGLSNSDEEESKITSTALKAVAIFSIFTTGISFLFLKSLETLFIDSTDYTNLFILTVITAFFSSLTQFAMAYMRIKRRVKGIFWLNIGNLSFSVVLNIILIVVFHMGLAGIVVTNAVAAVLFFLAVFVVAKVPFDLSFDWSALKKMLSYGLPNVPSHLQGTVMIIFGQYYISRVINPAELGLYTVAWKFCLPFQAVMGIVHSSWSAYKFDLIRNAPTPKKLMEQFILIMSIFYVGLYFGTAIFGPKVLLVMTEARFHEAQYLVPILGLIPLLNSYYYFLTTGISFGRHQYYMPVISFSGTIITILISIWWVPVYGSVAAAIGTAAGWLTMSVGAYLYGQHNYPLKLRLDVILGGITLSVALAGWIYFVKPHFLVQVLISGSIITLILFTCRHMITTSLRRP